MTRLLCGFLAVSLTLTTAFGQEDQKKGLSHTKHQPVANSSDPVTRSEARAVMVRAVKALRPIVKGDLSKISIAEGSQPISRDEFIGELHRIFKVARPNFKYTPTKVKYNRGVVAPVKNQAALLELIEWGCVGPLGPVATSKANNFTTAQFGDALGYFVVRLSDLTHRHDSKYSPNLMEGGL